MTASLETLVIAAYVFACELRFRYAGGLPVFLKELAPLLHLDLPTVGTPDVRLRDRPDRQGVWLESTRTEAGAVARTLAGLLPDAVPRELRGARRALC